MSQHLSRFRQFNRVRVDQVLEQLPLDHACEFITVLIPALKVFVVASSTTAVRCILTAKPIFKTIRNKRYPTSFLCQRSNITVIVAGPIFGTAQCLHCT